MATQTNSVISRSDTIASLARFRQEWQSSLNGQSLIDAQASVGLMLIDVVMMLGLSSEEQVAVLGETLRTEFVQMVKNRNHFRR